MALKVSLPSSQQPTNYPYLAPDQPSPRLPNRLKIHFNIILPFTPRSSKSSLTLGLPTKMLHAPLLFFIRATCPAHLIILYMITRIIFVEKYKSRASHNAVSPSPLLPRVSSAQICPSPANSGKPSASVLNFRE